MFKVENFSQKKRNELTKTSKEFLVNLCNVHKIFEYRQGHYIYR